MKVSEFIEWLKTQDQDATVKTFRHTSTGSYYAQGGICHQVNFSLDPETFEYTDFRSNRFSVGTPYETERTLLIGFDD